MTLPPIKKFDPNTTNTAILNAIRNKASIDYQRRIPEVTQANIKQTIENLLNWSPGRNEFVDALFNRIGAEIFRNVSWSNPYAKFKGGMLNYGDTIEEIFVGLLNAKVYDPNRPALEQELFGIHSPEVQTSFHKINRENYYVITVNDLILRRAFDSETGLSSMISQLMEAPNKSDNWDEFLTMAALFSQYENDGGFFHVNVPNLSDVDSDSADAKAALRKLRAFAGTLQFLSRHYNAAGLPVAADPDELELFITPDALAALDVEALAAAFNADKAEIPYRINIIPAEQLNIAGAQAILTTRDFFVVRDTLIETRQQPNAGSLNTNYFLHHHQIVSVSRFVPAILFWTGPSDELPTGEDIVIDIEPITVYDATGTEVVGDLIRGETYQIRAGAETDPTEAPNDAVTIQLLPGTFSSYTYLRPSGLTVIGIDEEATEVSYQITSVYDEAITATLTRGISGTRAVLWPNPSVTPDADEDGLYEVTPLALTKDEDDDTVIIPAVVGVQYRKEGVNVANGSSHVITVETDFDAVARAGYELTAGTFAWTFTP